MATKALMLVGFAIGPHYGEAALQAHSECMPVPRLPSFCSCGFLIYIPRLSSSNHVEARGGDNTQTNHKSAGKECVHMC